MTAKHFIAFLMVSALIVGFASQARAYTECDSDADCALGMRCELMAWETCVDVECPPGEPCPDPLPCEPEELGICVPGPCASDADCASGLQCMAVTYEECSGSSGSSGAPLPDYDCPPGEDCEPRSDPEPEPWDEECETVAENLCLPPYVAPCTHDADCGTGFTCMPLEICSCSGSGGDSGDGDGDMPAPPEGEEPAFIDEEECTCEPSGEGFCEPDMIACIDDSLCPTGWTCEIIGAVSVPCGIDPETGEEYCDEPDPMDTESFCMPPFWDIGWGVDGEGGAIEAATGDDGARIGDHRVLQSSSGCSAAPGAAGGPAALLLLIPLLVIARRKRG